MNRGEGGGEGTTTCPDRRDGDNKEVVRAEEEVQIDDKPATANTLPYHRRPFLLDGSRLLLPYYTAVFSVRERSVKVSNRCPP